MKRKVLALALALTLLSAAPVNGMTPVDFSGGALSGIVQDGDTLLVTDTYNKMIWLVENDTAVQAVGKIALQGLNGEPMGFYRDGKLDEALFMELWGIAAFLDGYAVTDAEANVVRYIDETGVRTAAGSGKAGNADGIGVKAAFDRPTGLAADGDGNLYIADTGNGSIRKMNEKGKVTTVLSDLADPTGLCWVDGTLYVAETGRSRILRVENDQMEVVAGDSTYLADGEYEGGYTDGPAEKARFDHPQGLAVAEDGTIYIADTGNHAVRKLANGQVTTMISAVETPEAPVQPRGMLLQGNTLIVADLFAQNLLFLDTTEEKVYLDIPNDAWYAEAVQKVTERGIVSGTGDGCFTPDAAVTRGMFAMMLSRLHQSVDGSAVIDGDADFVDVPADAWFAPAVRWAADRRIIVGDNGNFLPNDGITREALAAILYRYAGGMGYDVSARANLNGFSDTVTVSPYAVNAVSWAVSQGILAGSDGSLQPKSVASRAETAKMLVAFMDALEI